jgi:hypothetical protein
MIRSRDERGRWLAMWEAMNPGVAVASAVLLYVPARAAGYRSRGAYPGVLGPDLLPDTLKYTSWKALSLASASFHREPRTHVIPPPPANSAHIRSLFTLAVPPFKSDHPFPASDPPASLREHHITHHPSNIHPDLWGEA